MKIESIVIINKAWAAEGEWPYSGTLTLKGVLGEITVKLSNETVKRIFADCAPDAGAVINGAALQVASELLDRDEVTNAQQ